MRLINRKKILIALLLVTGVGFAEDADPVILDLKVPLAESADLLPAKLGASVYLIQSDWARVSEIGEDAAIWLRNYDRKKNIILQQVISLTLEIREPSNLRRGNLIAEKDVVVRYWPSKNDAGDSEFRIVQDLEELSHELKVEAYHLGREIEAILRSHFK
ncbi:MAG: hypothetical protein K9M49_08925 [Candidatus Marinimicrobia bacterium]|nr:hypothetical protein [Candidatus Neomarinimicrobiota bacterium]MCF7850425.1 hypothetical protein [Candidatus Neomarinimicrobiota bacterium]MCF7905258.1 hypothetical protein [Candidatus Neomarinimicrobiota bacterium]